MPPLDFLGVKEQSPIERILGWPSYFSMVYDLYLSKNVDDFDCFSIAKKIRKSGLFSLVFFISDSHGTAFPKASGQILYNNSETTPYSLFSLTDNLPSNSTTTITTYDLNQNYPNPFNPTTTIVYQLKQPGTMTLEIYNVLGQQVKVLMQGNQACRNVFNHMGWKEQFRNTRSERHILLSAKSGWFCTDTEDAFYEINENNVCRDYIG